MRGKVNLLICPVYDRRITPAYAGKSILQRCFLMFVQGSPPPMRGKVLLGFRCRFLRRITPAYAGKRYKSKINFPFTKDHPRLCGEKSVFFATNRGTKGSPPPMRGKATGQISIICPDRITPAYAGKSYTTFPQKIGKKDHPRLCGEKA